MEKNLTHDQLSTIEEILIEAQAFGLRREVDELARKDMANDPSLDPVLAYQIALDDWIK
jgi:uncharacterized protein YlaN (UPF0358 family)